jgi:hypothetical protein
MALVQGDLIVECRRAAGDAVPADHGGLDHVAGSEIDDQGDHPVVGNRQL